MREIRIVITDTSVSFPDGQELGRVGEHNATQLLIELPAEMVEGIDYHIIKFSLLGGAITSDIITEDDSKQIYISDGKIYCTLWQQLTASRGLSFTVEAYAVVDDEPVLIAKSPLVSGLRFDLSADAGAEVDEQGYSLAVHVNTLDERVDAAEGDISALEEDSHTHTNKSTLDGFSSLFEGILPRYNEMLIPLMATDTDYDNGTIAAFNSIGILKSAENSSGQPLLASEIVGTIDKAHEHDNMFVIDKFTEDDNGRPLYDGEPIGGGALVVDYFTDLPSDAVNGSLAFVLNRTPTAGELDLNECPLETEVPGEIDADYVAQGGTPYDEGYQDFVDSYTNLDDGTLTLGMPTYTEDALDIGTSGIQLSPDYSSNKYELLPSGIVLADSVENLTENRINIVPTDGTYTYGYMTTLKIWDSYFNIEEFDDNGTTKYRAVVLYVYAYEDIHGIMYGFDYAENPSVNLSQGWNAVYLVADETFSLERVDTIQVTAPSLGDIGFWDITLETSGTITDPQQIAAIIRQSLSILGEGSSFISGGLFLYINGEWRD